MLKKKSVQFALIYSIVVIAFKLFVFYKGMQVTKLGMYSHILSLLLIMPFVFLLIFLLRKEAGGEMSGKIALKESMVFVAVAAVILSVFNYVFFEREMGNYIVQYMQTEGPKKIQEQANKAGKPVTAAEINKIIAQEIAGLSAFKDTTSKLFSIIVFGLFSSFVTSIFLKRNANG